MQAWIISSALMIGGLVVALLGAGLSVASSRARTVRGGPLIRQDFAMVVLVVGVVAIVFGAGLLVFRLMRPF